MPLDATGVILAGGRSSRMGRNKALLPFRGETLIGRTARQFRAWFAHTVLVTNTPDEFAFLGLPMVGDAVPGQGPLGGIEAGLAASRHRAAFFAACDMPFLDQGLIAYLVSLAGQFDVVVPRVGGEYEPMHAVYTQECLAPIRQRLQAGAYKLIGFYDQVRVRTVEEAEVLRFGPPEKLFFNCNTPEDVERALRMA